MQPQSNAASLVIPAAIVFGFGLVAAAIFFSGFGGGPTAAVQPKDVPTEPVKADVRPLDKSDYVRGNPNAPIVVIEYSDYDCPFCKNFHDTMNTIMEEFAVGGKVAWTYRQFPLEQLHPNAPRISEAAFCVGELGGNEAFWKFSDSIFNERGVNEPTAMTKLPEFAVAAGVKAADFTSCLESQQSKS
jgi:protein-disulfide isomerase